MIVQYHCFGKKLVQYDIPVCNVPVFAPLPNQFEDLFKTCPGNTIMAEYFIPTTGTPVKVRIPANYHSEVENQIQTMLQGSCQ